MTEQAIYDRAINILDNFLEESFQVIENIPAKLSWKEELVFKLFKQSCHITFTHLSNSEKSKYQNEKYVTELILIGSLGRIIRDIYVNIIYLKTETFREDQMKTAWDFQVISRKLELTKFEVLDNYREQRVELEKEALLNLLKSIDFSTKGQLLLGKDDKLLSLQELADIKTFHKDKFYSEFAFFSQFTHSTAFANHFIKPNGIPLNLIAVTYDRIVAYFVGIVTESMELLFPKQKDLEYLITEYKKIIAEKWNVK